MAGTEQANSVLIPVEELHQIGMEALKLLGVPATEASTAIDVLLQADLTGIDTHGIQRLLMYAPKLRSGLINPRPKIKVEPLGSVISRVRGDNGLGQVVATEGIQEAIRLAKQFGTGFVGCEESNHFGAAAAFVQMACDEKLIGIVGTNAFPSMAPWGGLKNVVGNNPFAVGVPCEGEPDFVLDIALSVSSRGRIRQFTTTNESIPEGWAVDASGAPTTNALDALKGFVLPVGNHKGYGLALAVDILTGVLTGAGFADGVKSLIQQWDEPQHVGHSMFVIDPTRFMPWEDFSKRMQLLRYCMRAVPLIDSGRPIVIPGEPEARMQEKRRKEGIPIPTVALESLRGLAAGRYEYEMPKF